MASWDLKLGCLAPGSGVCGSPQRPPGVGDNCFQCLLHTQRHCALCVRSTSELTKPSQPER